MIQTKENKEAHEKIRDELTTNISKEELEKVKQDKQTQEQTKTKDTLRNWSGNEDALPRNNSAPDKLKTLKDLGWDERGKNDEEDWLVTKKELRAEAVKWVKLWKKNQKNYSKTRISWWRIEGKINCFQVFFNLTEEDLR